MIASNLMFKWYKPFEALLLVFVTVVIVLGAFALLGVAYVTFIGLYLISETIRISRHIREFSKRVWGEL